MSVRLPNELIATVTLEEERHPSDSVRAGEPLETNGGTFVPRRFEALPPRPADMVFSRERLRSVQYLRWLIWGEKK